MQELIKVYAQTPEKAAHFRGKHLQKAERYFPRLDQWCPPIYIGVYPEGKTQLAPYHHVPPDGSYIFLQDVDVIPGWDDFDAQTKLIYHELTHIVELKFMGRTAYTCDEKFAQAIQASVSAENMLVYVLLSHIMGI
jgi:hypothetical protein